MGLGVWCEARHHTRTHQLRLFSAEFQIDLKLSKLESDRPLDNVLQDGATNQSLEQLTHADASLDIVITIDVMENVRLDDRAHRKIYRVLKPCGPCVQSVSC